MENFSRNTMLSTVLYGCHIWQYSDIYSVGLVLLRSEGRQYLQRQDNAKFRKVTWDNHNIIKPHWL